MNKSQRRGNREQKKPKQEKPKAVAVAPSIFALPLNPGRASREKKM